MLAGQGSPFSGVRTARWLEPESNQTSHMSLSFRNSVEPQRAQATPGPMRSAAERSYQTSEVGSRKSCTTRSRTLGSVIGSWHFSQENATMGTPQTRWREMHQSGREAIILDMRSSPHSGFHFTSLMAFKVRARRSLRSMPTNHCSVARKMVALWQRQQCG